MRFAPHCVCQMNPYVRVHKRYEETLGPALEFEKEVPFLATDFPYFPVQQFAEDLIPDYQDIEL